MINVIHYLRGRKEYLKGQKLIWPEDSPKHRCAEARLHEVTELLIILETEKEKEKS